MSEKEKNAAVVLAAGQGKRMQSSVHKQYLLLRDKPVIYYALKAFQDSALIDEIILVAGKNEEAYCRTEIVERFHFTKVTQIIEGGRERYHSVANALKVIEGTGYVFIHDGARPFLTEEILARAYEAVKEYQACVAGMPVKDTIKVVDEAQFATHTPDRNTLWQVQTPQVFTIALAKEAYDTLLLKEEELKAQGIRITDDAMVVETLLSHPVKLIEGSYKNIKITTPEDLMTAEAFL